MKKIPTIFERDPDDTSRVTNFAATSCRWVIEGEGALHRKYDGTCVGYLEGPDGKTQWWARREVKRGKEPPAGFVPEEYDQETGKQVGWEPIEQSPFYKHWHEAWRALSAEHVETTTYELCGPKINGNPEGFDGHVLIRHHKDTEVVNEYAGSIRTYLYLRDVVQALAEDGWEGVVAHHPDGHMAKLKARDFSNE